jgi:predicted tellurium resistance membrane protein TerC
MPKRLVQIAGVLLALALVLFVVSFIMDALRWLLIIAAALLLIAAVTWWRGRRSEDTGSGGSSVTPS